MIQTLFNTFRRPHKESHAIVPKALFNVFWSWVLPESRPSPPQSPQYCGHFQRSIVRGAGEGVAYIITVRVPPMSQMLKVMTQLKRKQNTLRVQVPNNHILTQNLYYNYYYPNPKYLILGYMDPLGHRRPASQRAETRTVRRDVEGFAVCTEGTRTCHCTSG